VAEIADRLDALFFEAAATELQLVPEPLAILTRVREIIPLLVL